MGAPSSSSLLLLLFLVLAGVSSSARVGGWKPIKNPNDDPEVRSIAKFAVAQINRSLSEGEPPLVFLQVVSGETQVVAGINYRLIIKTKSGAGVHTYKAVVWDKPWQNFRKLTSFRRVDA